MTAKQIAKIIMNGKNLIDTEYGGKTLEGVADLISKYKEIYIPLDKREVMP